MATIRCNYETNDSYETFPLIEISSSDNETDANRIFLSHTPLDPCNRSITDNLTQYRREAFSEK